MGCDSKTPFDLLEDETDSTGQAALPTNLDPPDSAGFTNIEGCDGQFYIHPKASPYVLPWDTGLEYKTGLVNCSESFHAEGNPDQYAYDFQMPIGTVFTAARGGVVFEIVEDQPSEGGGPGNHVVIDHGDGTYSYYLHSPQNGIGVEVGQTVSRGDILGITGQSGQAGYPHLHFIVVRNDPAWPYVSIPISFSNASPQHVPLNTLTIYEALAD